MTLSLGGRPVAVLDAPSNLGLKPPEPGRQPGTKRAPAAYREHGLIDRLRVEDAGAVQAPAYQPERDPESSIRNVAAIAEYTPRLAARISELLDAGRFPLVLGGDCSILLAGLLAVSERGRAGLVFVDGHWDIQTPRTTGSGGAAGMDVALALGLGPDALTRFGGRGPLLTPEDVAIVGARDAWDYYTADPDVARIAPRLLRLPLDRLRQRGCAGAARAALTHLEAHDALWLHVDVDVLTPEIMPAVDSPDPDGLTYEELGSLLDALLRSGRITGMELTIYDPDRDPGGAAGRRFVDWLVDLLQRTANDGAARARI